jgi:pimeloyl-ACP methyl ester carboxylesterase
MKSFSPKLLRHGLLLAFLFVLTGCSTHALRSPAPAEPPYRLANPAENHRREGRLALIRTQTELREPRIYLLERFDSAKPVVVMLHGLGSSPDVWAPIVAAIDADPSLRDEYQIWQVFYPTNTPIPENLRAIRAALLATFAALDPAGAAPATHDVTLIGHSMGGVIARLLVVESGNVLWCEFFGRDVSAADHQRYAVLEPYLSLEPLPQVSRTIFLAAPHRGSPLARGWRNRVASLVVRAPVAAVQTVTSIAETVAHDTPLRAAALRQRRSSITNLSDRDDYLRATVALPVAPGVAYHSIIGRRDASAPLEVATDGIVPYASAHLDGAASELVVASRHNVYDSPEAIAEVRRILTENINRRRLP